MSPRSGSLHTALLAWYAAARRDLPWRGSRDPYAIWVSETMLQQTRVETAVPYYERFMAALPTVQALAEAPEERVLALWSGLGYYRRARMLHAAAQRVVQSFGGCLPATISELRSLDGVGAYTAGAVASIAFGQPEAVVDGNVARVLSRLYAVEKDIKSADGVAELWSLARALVAASAGAPEASLDPGAWNQSLMELGATVCLPRVPRCSECPVRPECVAHARGLQGELPRVRRNQPPRPVRRVAIVLRSRRAVLLARRVAGGLFGGLWEPPGVDVPRRGSSTTTPERQKRRATSPPLPGAGVLPAAVAALLARLKIDVGTLVMAGEVTHVLSHRRLHVMVYAGALDGRRTFDLPSPEYDAIESVPRLAIADRAHASLTLRILEVAKAVESSLL